MWGGSEDAHVPRGAVAVCASAAPWRHRRDRMEAATMRDRRRRSLWQCGRARHSGAPVRPTVPPRSPRRARPRAPRRCCVAMSAWLTMPTSRCPSITGSRRTLCSVIVRSASSIESSAPIVTVFPSPAPSSPAFTEPGSLPWASALTTMSRSVSIPFRRSSSPQIGSDPTSSSASRLAASTSESFSPMHVQSGAHDVARGLVSHALPPSSRWSGHGGATRTWRPGVARVSDRPSHRCGRRPRFAERQGPR